MTMRRPNSGEVTIWTVLILATLAMAVMAIRPVWSPVAWARGIDGAAVRSPPR